MGPKSEHELFTFHVHLTRVNLKVIYDASFLVYLCLSHNLLYEVMHVRSPNFPDLGPFQMRDARLIWLITLLMGGASDGVPCRVTLPGTTQRTQKAGATAGPSGISRFCSCLYNAFLWKTAQDSYSFSFSWQLNSGTCTCQAGAMPLSYTPGPQVIFFMSIITICVNTKS